MQCILIYDSFYVTFGNETPIHPINIFKNCSKFNIQNSFDILTDALNLNLGIDAAA